MVYNGELEGITKGIEYASLQAKPGHRFCVFLDNQAALMRLAKLSDLPGQARQIRAIAAAKKIKEKEAKISLSWVPGHSRIDGNEKADELAPLHNVASFAKARIQIANIRKQQWVNYLQKNEDNHRHVRAVYRRKFDWIIKSKPCVRDLPKCLLTRRLLDKFIFSLKRKVYQKKSI